MKIVQYFLPVIIIMVSGCGNLNSVYRSLDVDDGSGALIDIKQRAIIASTRKTKNSDGSELTSVIVCAEPSPDALSAYAAEVTAAADVPATVTAQLAAASQESSSFVGLRTQSIQLLRDSLYRLCEGYMSGAIDKPAYEILVRRYQKYMVALLGIEQLTGTIRAPSVTINTEGSAEASRSISVMKNEIESIDSKIKKLEDEKKSLEEEKGKAETASDRKNVITVRLEEIERQVISFGKDKEAITNGIANARGLVSKGSATAIVSQVGIPSSRSDEHIQAVAASVEKIILNIINTDDLGQLCFSYLQLDPSYQQSILSTTCKSYFDNLNRHILLKIKAQELTLKLIDSSNNATDKDKAVLEGITKSKIIEGLKKIQ